MRVIPFIFSLALCQGTHAEVPSTLNYQGRVIENGAPYTGTGHFVFAMFDGSGSVIWNNWQGRVATGMIDPGGSGLDTPKKIAANADPLPVQVRNGLFSLNLGSGSIGSNNTPIDTEVFFDATSNTQRARSGMKLAVWFSSAPGGSYARLDPDIPFASVPFAMVAGVAETVSAGSITLPKIAPGALLGALGDGVSRISTQAMDAGLLSRGYVRLEAAMAVGNISRYLYEKASGPVNRMGLAKADGSVLVNGQSAPLDLSQPGRTVLTLQNLGNQALTGLAVSISGLHAADFSPSLASTSVPVGGTTTLTVNFSTAAWTERGATLTVNAPVLGGSYQIPLRGVVFATIPAGSFTMGRTGEDANDRDLENAPPTIVAVSAFSMKTTEVTKGEWDLVRTWGLANGYTDLVAGSGFSAGYPVCNVNWYQVAKWCNARSQMDGKVPCYYTNNAQTLIYKTGNTDLGLSHVKWTADGYRLPTEAEWEKAARGGFNGRRFPWGDTISHNEANFYSTVSWGNFDYDLGPTTGRHPNYDYHAGSYYASPVGSFSPNGYGLYDMSGNVSEWCWGSLGTYRSLIDPRGYPYGANSLQSYRGGENQSFADECRIAIRKEAFCATANYGFGFRPVRRLP